MVLNRQLVVGSYRGGGFRGDYQTCITHVWRKGESLAVTHSAQSTKQTYNRMLLGVYYTAKDAAAAVTGMADGPADSACRIGSSVRAVPDLTDLAASAQAQMANDPSKVIHAYHHTEVSHPDTCKVRRHPGEDRPAHARVHRPPRACPRS